MPARIPLRRFPPSAIILVPALILLLLAAGCVTTEIGPVAYNNGTCTVQVTNSGDTSDLFVQLTVYELRNLRQEEMTVIQVPVTLHPGSNTVAIPIDLPAGSYKMYVYILTGSDRKTAAIRDITV